MNPAFSGGVAPEMMFRKRRATGLGERVQNALWPRTGWRRALLYLSKRMTRLAGTPHAVALGCAIGIYISFTPFIGLHIILSYLIAVVLGANVLASALGTIAGNPLTFPIIWVSSYSLGRTILGTSPGSATFDQLADKLRSEAWLEIWPNVLQPMFIGGVILGLPFALAAYGLARAAVASYQIRRKRRLARRARSQDSKPADRS